MKNRLAPQSASVPGSAPVPVPGLDASIPAVPDHQLLHRIGVGAYGEVWLARTVLGEWRAVKVIRRAAFGGDTRPFERELAGIRRYEPVSRSDPSQVAILHVGRAPDDSLFYYVMELADAVGIQLPAAGGPNQGPEIFKNPTASSGGGVGESETYTPRTLRHDLKTRGRLPVGECVELGLALTRALGHLHGQGLVHRDVKPSNIIFVGGRPKLADIGLVTSAAVGDDIRSIVGTEGYLAPEGPGTPQADLYALGRVLYEAASGRDRRDFPDLPHGWPEVPEVAAFLELNEIIVTACAADPRERYASAETMRADLERLGNGGSIRRREAWRRGLRRGGKLALAAGIVALLAVGLNVIRDQTRPRASINPANSSKVETFETSGTTNREAYNLYLLGRESRRGDMPPGVLRAIDHFQSAISLDARFARAHGALATAYARLDALETVRPSECRPRSYQSAMTALALDPALGEAHGALGSYFFHFKWDWLSAERFCRRSVELSPNHAWAKAELAQVLSFTGRHGEAIRLAREVREANPEVAALNTAVGKQLAFAMRLDEAEVEMRKTFEIDPNIPTPIYQLAMLRCARGDYEEGFKLFDRYHVLVWGEPAEKPAHEAYLKAGGGKMGLEAYSRNRLGVMNERESKRKPDDWIPPMNWVDDYMLLGDFDNAFRYWFQGLDERQPMALYAILDPFFSRLWKDPRYDEVLRRTRLDKYFPERMHSTTAPPNGPK